MELVTIFFQLKEYDSLCRELLLIESQKNDLIDRLKRREAELENSLKEQKELIQKYQLLDQELTQLDQQLKQRLSEEAKNQCEEKALTLLSEQEDIARERDEKTVFIEGFRKTIHEISQETTAELQGLDQKLNQTQMRIQSLFEEFPDDWKRAIQKARDRKHPIGPFTKIQDARCAFCRFSLSREAQSEIDQELKLKACSGCGRLFLPYQVVSGTRG